MKSLILTFLFSSVIFISTKVTGKTESKESKEDKEFEMLMKDFKATMSKNNEVQVKADKAKDQIVTETVSKMVEMKKEVSALKTELNEVKIKLDSAGIDTGSSYRLLPISQN